MSNSTRHQQPRVLKIRAIPASATHELRHAVLWPHKPLSYVRLPEDEAGQHFGAFVSDTLSDDAANAANTAITVYDGDAGVDEDVELVSIISLFIDDGHETGSREATRTARFRKFATAVPWQGRGVGSALLEHAIGAAARAGSKSIWCDARQAALPFYQKFGLSAEGEVFFKGDVPYMRMSMALSCPGYSSSKEDKENNPTINM